MTNIYMLKKGKYSWDDPYGIKKLEKNKGSQNDKV